MCLVIFTSSTYDAGPPIAAISENGLIRNAINRHIINENEFSSLRAFDAYAQRVMTGSRQNSIGTIFQTVGTYDNNLDLFLSGPTSWHTSKSGHCVIHCIY